MLSGRYIHLHEALGLGPMWLSARAKIADKEQETAPTVPTAHATTAPVSMPLAHAPDTRPAPTRAAASAPSSNTIIRTPAPNARLAVLQRLGQLQQSAPPSAPPPQPTAHTVEHYLAQLRNSIAPRKLMAMSLCASPADVAAGSLFSGEDGKLLQRMFAAIKLSPDDVHLTTWLKDLPDFNPKPPADTVAAALPRVSAEWQLCRPRALLVMGNFFERDDVLTHLHQLRQGVPYFLIPHPMRILSNPKLRAPAWETLQQLQTILAQP